MGPLVYYCRWRGVRLRLHGRDGRAVWGEFVAKEDGNETAQTIRFDLETWTLQVGEGDDATWLRLDELGVVLDEGDGEPPTSSSDAWPTPR